MSITQFTMEEVRCFGERQTLEIRPLTFLVGENSTGKTTALACFNVLADYLRGAGIDFNQPPYSMGIFKDIVRNSTKKEKIFKLGFASKCNSEDIETTIELVEKKAGIEPVVSSITMKLTDGEIIVRSEDAMGKKELRLDSFDEEQNRYRITCNSDRLNEYSAFFFFPPFTRESKGEIAFEKYFGGKIKKFGCSPWDVFRTISVFSTSPIRSQPKRTYDPTREFYDPEGSDVPMLLMRIEATEKKEWEKLKQQLIEFGTSSGLFQDIKIKNFGRSLGGPFQLQFKVRGPTSNIIDVGYGVSQILPILVQILNHGIRKGTEPEYDDMSYFLLQQPEVHLHPRAQAELSSLLVNLASQENRSFIVETHSDYIIDRARIEIRKGNIKPEDVSLIYFEPKGNIVNVHNIGFDEMANMTNVPTHYRNFFLKESKRLMGFED
ncbi:MAG: AAA family ATPase [Candidatus Poribacteria bacterium]|nr:AAA family ATPase [Candidatus Poribacteria bacterium]